jgi:hypothetical protein
LVFLYYFFSLGDIELVRSIQNNVNNGEFVLILRTDGRIVAMSDEVEHHLGKTMVKKKAQIFSFLNLNRFSSSVHYILNVSIFSNVLTALMEINYIRFFKHPMT